jgi:hypothetical protein
MIRGDQYSSANDIHARELGLRRFDFLSNFDPLLIGLNRSAIRILR